MTTLVLMHVGVDIIVEDFVVVAVGVDGVDDDAAV